MSTRVRTRSGKIVELDDNGNTIGGGTSGGSAGVAPKSTWGNQTLPGDAFNKSGTTSEGQTSKSGTSGGSGTGGGGNSGYNYPNTSSFNGGQISGTGGYQGQQVAMDWISTIANVAQTIFNDINQVNQQKFTNKMNSDYLELAKQQQGFTQGLQSQTLGLNKQQTAENLATSGQARAQSAITFQQSQQDRRKQAQFMKALSTGIAQGLARKAQPAQASALTTAPSVSSSIGVA